MDIAILIALFLLALVSLLAEIGEARLLIRPDAESVVATVYGKVRGFVVENEENHRRARIFLGTPFAQPPRRFEVRN